MAKWRTKKEFFHELNNSRNICFICKKLLNEDEAMEAPDGQLIHEDCYEQQ